MIDINTFNGRVRGGSSTRINSSISGDNFRTNAFRSNYHGMQMVVRKNFSNGLQFNANYTWAKAIDYLSDAFNNARGNFLRPTDNFNWALDRGNADFDIRHRFVISYFYELPWMKDNRWIGGWTFSGIASVQTGVPVPIFAGANSGDANADGYTSDRPLYLGTGNINNQVNHNVSPAEGYISSALFDTIDRSQDCPSGLPNGGAISVASTINPVTGAVTSAGRWWCNSDMGPAC